MSNQENISQFEIPMKDPTRMRINQSLTHLQDNGESRPQWEPLRAEVQEMAAQGSLRQILPYDKRLPFFDPQIQDGEQMWVLKRLDLLGFLQQLFTVMRERKQGCREDSEMHLTLRVIARRSEIGRMRMLYGEC